MKTTGSIPRAVIKRLVTILLILVSIVILTQSGLYLADQGRRTLPVTLGDTVLHTLQHTSQYLFSHPPAYVWHTAVTPWWQVVIELFRNSAGLLLVSLVVAVLAGVSLGIFAALSRRAINATLMVLFSTLGISTPSFLLGMLFWVINIAVSRLTGEKPLPPTGFGWDVHLILPALVLAMRPFAQIMQITYISLGDVLSQDYIRAAQARGVPMGLIVFRHALRNIWIPILTTLSTSLRFQLSSLPVVEFFFLWPGIGLTLLQAISSNNTFLVTDLVVSLGLLFLIFNLFLDVVFPRLDPRLQTVGQQAEEEWGYSLRDLLEEWFSIFKPRKEFKLPPLGKLPLSSIKEDQTELYVIPHRGYLRIALTSPAFMVGTIMVLGLAILAIWGPNLANSSPYETNGVMMIEGEIQAPPFTPSRVFPWGSDPIGRDVQALVLSGTRQTLTLAVLAVLARFFLGILLGMLAGWRQNSWFDRMIQALSAVWAAFPATVFAIIIILGIGIQKGMSVFIIALCAIGWGEVEQYIRGQVINQKPRAYIEAARSAGARPVEILTRHILPHLLPAILTLAILEMGGVLILLAELGFLNIFLGGGFRVEIGEIARMVPIIYFYSDVPEWGAQLANIRDWWRSYPWLAWYPGLFFFLAVLAFNLWGEGLRHFLTESKININRFINRYSLGSVIVLLIASTIAIRANAPVQQYRTQGLLFDEKRAIQHVAALSGPDLNGRESGTEGARLAAEYIASQMEEIGLQPPTTEGTYIFPQGTTTIHQAAPPVLELGDGQTMPVYRQDYMEYITNDARVGENRGQVVGVAISPLIQNNELPKVKLTSPGLENKILLIRQADLPWVQVSDYTALLVVGNEPNLPEKRYLYPLFLRLFMSFKNPAVLITPDLADRVLVSCNSSLETLEEQAQAAALNTFTQTQPGAMVHINVPVIARDAAERQYNVIGVLPGSGSHQLLPNGRGLDSQLIVVSAYFDGLGRGSDGTVYPGANDNASGVAEMLEIARVLRQGSYEPKKTIIFIAWGLGERGIGFGVNELLNATGYLGMLTQEVIVELSGVGAGSGEGIALETGTSFRMVNLVQKIGRQMGIPVTNRGRSPHFGLNTQTALSGRSALGVFLSWDGSDETAHTPRDTFENLDPVKLKSSGQLTTLLVTIISRELEY